MSTHKQEHTHDISTVGDRPLLLTIVINLGLSLFEFIAGLISGSVALMADALHNTNDAAALVIAYVARKVSRKRADAKYTFGYRRAELVGAMIQLTALILVGLFLAVKALQRLITPEPLLGGWIMLAAGLALIVDVGTAWLLWAMSKGSLNLKAAFLHNLTDAGASVAVLAGGAAVYWLDWTWIDPVLTLGIAGYILWMSWGLLRRTIAILMESAPDGLDVAAVSEDLAGVDGIEASHHLHAWQIDEAHWALEAHLVVKNETSLRELEGIKAASKKMLQEKFSIEHSTLEFESEETTRRRCSAASGDL